MQIDPQKLQLATAIIRGYTPQNTTIDPIDEEPLKKLLVLAGFSQDEIAAIKTTDDVPRTIGTLMTKIPADASTASDDQLFSRFIKFSSYGVENFTNRALIARQIKPSNLGQWDYKEDHYDDRELIKRADSSLQEYLRATDGKFSDQAFEQIKDLAKQYVADDQTYNYGELRTNPRIIVAHAQLLSLIRDPNFLKDIRSVTVIEELADLTKLDPFPYNNYVNYENGRGYVLRPDFNIKDHLPTIQRLADSDRLFNGQSDCVKRHLFSSIGELLNKLTQSEADKRATIGARAKILERYGDRAEVKSVIVYSLTEPWEIEAANGESAMKYYGMNWAT